MGHSIDTQTLQNHTARWYAVVHNALRVHAHKVAFYLDAGLKALVFDVLLFSLLRRSFTLVAYRGARSVASSWVMLGTVGRLGREQFSMSFFSKWTHYI